MSVTYPAKHPRLDPPAVRQLTLPPKRYDKTEDPKFDPVRHLPWFPKMDGRAKEGSRRDKLKRLEMAYEDWNGGKTQKEVCAIHGVIQRNLSDFSYYTRQRTGRTKFIQCAVFQQILDEAYVSYCRHGGKYHLYRCIQKIAPLWGVKSRPVFEAWCVDPNFLPREK